MNEMPGIEYTPVGYQGAAQHTYTANCDGFHEPGQCKASVVELAGTFPAPASIIPAAQLMAGLISMGTGMPAPGTAGPGAFTGTSVIGQDGHLIPDPAYAASIARKEAALTRLRAIAAGEAEVPGQNVVADLLALMGY